MQNRFFPAAFILAACALVSFSAASCGDPTNGTPDAGNGAPDAGNGAPDAGGNNQPDAGSNDKPDAGPQEEGCGSLTFEGECDGTTVRYCNETNDEVVTLDCADIFEDEAGTCAFFPNDFGAWCAFPEGGPCLDADFACGDATGASPTLACDIVSGTCVKSTQSCTFSETDEFEPRCDGALLQFDCEIWNQPVAANCTDPLIGGTGCSNGACIGIPAGGDCDDEFLLCATGLVCSNDGECVSP